MANIYFMEEIKHVKQLRNNLFFGCNIHHYKAIESSNGEADSYPKSLRAGMSNSPCDPGQIWTMGLFTSQIRLRLWGQEQGQPLQQWQVRQVVLGQTVTCRGGDSTSCGGPSGQRASRGCHIILTCPKAILIRAIGPRFPQLAIPPPAMPINSLAHQQPSGPDGTISQARCLKCLPQRL